MREARLDRRFNRRGRHQAQGRGSPVGGKANAEVEHFLAELLGVPRSDVAVIRGTSGRDKTVLVLGLARAETQQALAPYLP